MIEFYYVKAKMVLKSSNWIPLSTTPLSSIKFFSEKTRFSTYHRKNNCFSGKFRYEKSHTTGFDDKDSADNADTLTNSHPVSLAKVSIISDVKLYLPVSSLYEVAKIITHLII